jgi:hypothetical protein
MPTFPFSEWSVTGYGKECGYNMNRIFLGYSKRKAKLFEDSLKSTLGENLGVIFPKSDKV